MTNLGTRRDLDAAVARAVDNTLARCFTADARGNHELAEFFAGVLVHIVGAAAARRKLGRLAAILL